MPHEDRRDPRHRLARRLHAGRAHAAWDVTIAPGLSHLDPREGVALELHLERSRAAIEGRSADPGAEVRALREGLASALAALPGGD
jgi:hypothetical protein